MTLQVPLSEYAVTIQRVLGVQDAYVSRTPRGVLVTSASPSASVVAISNEEPEAVRDQLAAQGVTCFEGAWHTEISADLLGGGDQTYVGAVAYKTGEDQPGIWVDAFGFQPTQVQVLRAIYDEFRSTGEVDDIPFEEFVRQAHPNVVILTPIDLHSFVEAKGNC